MKTVFRWLVFCCILPLSVFGQLEFGPRVKLTDPISRMEASRIVDMDGDGDLDVAATIQYKLELAWFENDGNGNFTRHDWRADELFQREIIGIADHDGDGRQDVWLEEYEGRAGFNHRYRYSIAKGLGGGGFGSAMPVAMTPDFSENGSASLVADLNGDGHFDILGNGFVFLGTQAQGFSVPVRLPLNADFDDVRESAIHDYDEDGDLDLFIREERRLLYCKNTGGGQFAAPIVLVELSADRFLVGFAFVKQEIINAPPLLVVHTRIGETDENKLFSYRRQSDETVLRVEEFTLPAVDSQDYSSWEFARADSSSTHTYLSQTSGQFSSDNIASRLYELKYGEAGLSITLLNTHQGFTDFDDTAEADLNGDGLKDLVVMIPSLEGWSQSASDHILWYQGSADGSFQDAPSTAVPAAYERSLMLADDLEGDGDNDLVFGLAGPLVSLENGSRIAVWSNQGNGVDFEKRTFIIPGTNPNSPPSVLGIEDFVTLPPTDGGGPTGLPFDLPEGRKDLIILSAQRWPGSGSQVHLALQSAAGNYYLALAGTVVPDSTIRYEDWDGDGARDLIYYGWDGALSWSKRTGYRFGSRQEIMVFPTYLSSSILLDMDRDGDLDVYGQGSLFGPNTSYWAEHGPEGSILSIRRLATPLYPLYFDADGDGVAESTALFGNSGGINPIVDYRFENTDLEIFYQLRWGLFDFDADGDLDVLDSASPFGTLGFQSLIWHENQGGGPSFSDETGLEFAGVELSDRNHFALKDMDGDGTRDLLVVSSDSALVEWFKITHRKGPQAFADWMAGQNLTGSSAGPRADWDKDRRTNWEEFIYGTQASMNDSGYGREPHLETASGGIQFAYTRRKSGNGLSLAYGMQRSTTLNGDWEPWNPDVTTPPSSGDYETIRIPINPEESAEFFRVKLPGIPE